MIDAKRLLAELKRMRRRLEDDLRAHHAASAGRAAVVAEWRAASDAARTRDTFETFWSAALDQPGLSGIAGYAFKFDANPSWTCDEILDLGVAPLSVTSADLAQGNWYFHLCAKDVAGNWGAVVSAGPFVVNFASLPFQDGFE